VSKVRFIIPDDVRDIVALSDIKRTQYATYQPLFWNKAQDGVERQTAYFLHLLNEPNMIMLCHYTANTLNGFIIASVAPAPPVYDIGGLNCMVDDFCVRDETLWSSVGQQLLDEAMRHARSKGAVQVVVVTGHHHKQKRDFLQNAGLSLASEWYTSAIPDELK